MISNYIEFCGWIDNPQEVKLSQTAFGVETISFYNKIAGTGEGKTVLLHKIYEAATGLSFPVWKQEIGDCVSFGYALAVSVLMAVQKSVNAAQQIPGPAATEPIYGGSRVEIGNHNEPRKPSEGDGSTGVWAAQWIKQYGVLLRSKYNNFDLASYSGERAKEWGWKGVPDDLEPIAKQHPVLNYALVTTYEEARDALSNGYPVTVCSNQGFVNKRDDEGFARPYGTWAHCMCFVAVDDAYERPGLLCCNSWGNAWIEGPKRHDQPDGSFWVDAEIVDRMLGMRDSYALSNFVGFEQQNMMAVMKKFNLI